MIGDLRFAAYQGSNHIAQKLSYAVDRRMLSKPNKVTVIITDACAARCLMCDIWKLQAENELSADEWKSTLDELRAWLGPFFLVISGGEPFQRRDMFDILAHCRDIGIKTKMSSNGMFLTKRTCERILEVGPDFLSLSVDTHEREVHDRLRGVPLYDKCVDAIEYLRSNDEGIVLGVASILMEETYRELASTARWAIDLGVDRVLYQPLYPTFASDEEMDPRWYERNPHWPRDPEAVQAALEEVLRLKRDGLPIWNPDEQLEAMQHYFRDPFSHPRPDECMVRYNTFNMDARGNVNFCWTVDDVVGNVRESSPREIWESRLADDVREKMKPCQAPCLLNCYRSSGLKDQVKLFKLFADRQGF